MVKIGLIGSNEFGERIKKIIKEFPNLDPFIMSSDNIYDAPKITKKLIEYCDTILYSGYIPYSISKNIIPSHVAAHYIPLKGESLYRAIYRLKNKVSKLNTLSIDTIDRTEMEHLNSQLNESIQTINFQSFVSLKNVSEVVDFHQSLYINYQIQGALTGLKIVSDKLTEKGVPNEWILPTDGDIIISLERALLATEQRRQIEAQIVFGIVQIDNFEQLKRQITSDQENQRLQLDIQRNILDFVDDLDGYSTALDSSEYLFVTTRGTLERITQGYKYFPLISDVKKECNVNISVGIGFGTTAYEAGTHARMALLQSIDSGGKKCFIVKEDRSVIGPVENKAPLTYPLNITDKDALGKIKKSSVSSYYLGKVISILNRKNTKTFTAIELASSLGITPRSANRILVSWLDSEIVEIVGIEKLQTRGRPRQLYKVNFSN